MRPRQAFIFLLITHLLTALFSSGVHHFDEYFQIWEMAAFKLGLTAAEELPWEYSAQIRSWWQPGLTYLWVLLLKGVGIESPFSWMTGARLLMALLGVHSWWLVLKKYRPKREKRLYYLLGVALWFLPYIHARTSGENFGLILFSYGLFFFPNRHLRAGFFFGLSFLARFQMALAIIPLCAWVLYRRRYRSFFLIVTAGLLTLPLGFLLDYWGYGEWTFSAWNYFKVNLLENKASQFGVSPWWDYFKMILLKGIPPLSLLFLVSGAWFFYRHRQHPLTWAFLPFLLIHSAIGHKELRFLFPMFPFIWLALFYFLLEYPRWRAWRKTARLMLSLNLVMMCIAMLKPPNSSWGFFRYLAESDIKTLYYYRSEDPLTMLGLPLKLFMPTGMERKPIEDWDRFTALKEQSPHFYITAKKASDWRQLQNDPSCTTLTMNYPPFVLKFNLGNWLERSKIWAVLDCQKEPGNPNHRGEL